MREIIRTPSNHPPIAHAKLSSEQLEARSRWRRIPDALTGVAALHVLHVTPENDYTVTTLNPVDPGTVGDLHRRGYEDDAGPGWLLAPHAAGMLGLAP